MHKYRGTFIIFSLFLVCMPQLVDAWGVKWSRTGNLNMTRGGHWGVSFTDGRVMLLGGFSGDQSGYEIFDPATGMWTRALLPNIESGGHTIAMLLPNGKILDFRSSGYFNIFDPSANTWSSSAVSGWATYRCATLLKNGDLLLIGYDAAKKCRLYDYTGDAVTSTSDTKSPHPMGDEILLPSGKVLLCGGESTGVEIKSCELYTPSSGTWAYTDTTKYSRRKSSAVLLPDPWNKVLIAGGINNNKKCELYDINTNKWSNTDDTHDSRNCSSIALLPSGNVLIIGGDWGSSAGYRTCELYNPDADTWSYTDSTLLQRNHLTASILPTGKVLVGGRFLSSDTFTTQCEIYDPSQGQWETKASLNTARECQTVTPLRIYETSNCSTNVLIAGGENGSGALNSCELYNYDLNWVKTTDNMATARTHHTAILLSDGRVLVAGGKNGGGALNSCELYSIPAGEVWSTTVSMGTARFDHTATVRRNGDILVTGGEGGSYLNSCEVYNGSNWVSTGAMATARARHSAVLLLNGKVMVIGGETSLGNPTNSCELYNGSTWASAASMATARSLFTATLLQSGKVLVVGGKGTGGAALSSCEIYDPVANTWTTDASLNTARYGHNATLLYSGLVLISGGTNGTSYYQSCEIFDPATRKYSDVTVHEWKVTASLSNGRAYQSSVIVPSDKPWLLTLCGKTGSGSWTNSIERYDVGLGYRSAWQSTITNYPSIVPSSSFPSMNITGTLFRGVSEADGGNHCHIASNDHPVIALLRVGGGNFQGNGGGDMLYMPPSSSWNETHTNISVPDTAPTGYYRLWSIVNGIPCKWHDSCGTPGAIDNENSEFQPSNPELTIYPNPVIYAQSIKFQLAGLSTLNSLMQETDVASQLPVPQKAGLTLNIYNLSGRLVKSFSLTTNNQQLTANVTWDGRNNNGDRVEAGIYFYHINTVPEINGKFVILKP